MKTFKLFSLLLAMTIATSSFAQTKTETIPVSGNCEMCKSNIEKAAKKAGATNADWSIDAKMLTVTYNTSSTDAAKIQQTVAAAGYDTRDVKTTDAAYKKLHACCRYAREGSKNLSCCEGKCDHKDGKCSDASACKGMDMSKGMDCCKSGTCTKKS